MNKKSVINTSLPKQNIFLRVGIYLGNVGINFLKLFTKKNTYVEIICALLIILFLYTGINKLSDLAKFHSEMGRSPFIEDMSRFITYAIPIGEIMLSLLLIISRTRLLGLYLSYGLMALFTGYIWLMLNYAYDLPCSCGGIISELTWEQHLIFNACFTVVSMIGILLQAKFLHTKLNKQAT